MGTSTTASSAKGNVTLKAGQAIPAQGAGGCC